MNVNLMRYTAQVTLIIMLVTTPILSLGCQEEEIPPAAPSPGMQLSATLVPNMDLAVYAYVKQETPTILPRDITGTPSDLSLESLALWGVPSEAEFTFGGGLTLNSATDAAEMYALMSSQPEIWTKLSEKTVYFVQGSGAVAETLKTAISRNDFKYYDDQEALREVALLPDGGITKLAAVGIAQPNKMLVKLMAKNVSPEATSIINTLITWARLQLITVGLYAPHQIEVSDILLRTKRDTMLESDLGILALVKSGLPGFLVSPIVPRFLDDAGYTKTVLGELTVYKGYLDYGNGEMIPVILRVEGNRLFAAISGKESYAEALITSVNAP